MKFFTGLFTRRRPDADDPLARLLDDATWNTARRAEFYRALLEQTLYVPGQMEQGELLVRPYDVDGRKALLLFSSPAKLQSALRDRPGYVAVPARAMFQAAATFDGVILNYGAPRVKEFTHSEIAALLDGSIFTAPAATDHSNSIVLGQPKEYPVPLMEALRQGLPTRPEIRAAYIAQMYATGSQDEPRIVIAFDAAMSDSDFHEFLERVRSLSGSLGHADILFTRLESDGLGEYLRSETAPFYSVG
jgi:hypothetical protein